MNNAQHYNHITDLWPLLLGKNFHWGLFDIGDLSLESATDRLIDRMLSFINYREGLKMLDIGCGIGEPAFYVANRCKLKITGISNSESGINTANASAQKLGLSGDVNFFMRDACDNRFPDGTFDICWLMEMSHLIENKEQLIKEATRVLKTEGEFILCDLILKRELTPKEIFLNKEKLLILGRSFGKAQLRTTDYYIRILESSGLKEIKVLDISIEVQRTLDFWITNAKQNREVAANLGYSADIENFITSCEILKEYYYEGTWGYAIFYGKK